MASLKTLLRNAAATAVKALGDVPEAIVYVQVVPGTYNPNTGLTPTTETSHSLSVPLVRLRDNEVEYFPAADKTRRALIPYLSLPIEPSRNDYITVGGVRWEIKKIRRVPTDALFVFYCESP